MIYAGNPIQWVKGASRGLKLTYYSGYLFVDRDTSTKKGHEKTQAALVNKLAGEFMALADAGLVCLVQRRAGDHDYDYIAVRTRKPFPSLADM